MALKATRTNVKSGSSVKLQAPLMEVDNYPGRLVQVIDLGRQQNFFDKEKINHEVLLTYELAGEYMLDEQGNPVEDKPRWFSETINMINLPLGMSFDEIVNDQYRGKSKMVQRAKTFDPRGALDFDFSEMLGSPCVVTIVQKKKKDGTMKNDIGGVTGVMRGMAVPELVNPPKVFALDDPDMEVFKSLPEFRQEKIMENLEYRGSKLEALINGGSAPEPKPTVVTEKVAPAAAQPAADDDIPW